MLIRAVIIDDEQSNRENLTNILREYCPDVSILASAASASQGMDIIREHKPDLVFLDIEMPGGNGFKMLECLQNIDFEIIFVTAHDQYAINAIRFNALDYLLKPVDILALKTALEKFEVKIGEKRENDRIRNFLENHHLNQDKHRIALPTLDKVEFIAINKIIRCEGESNYTHFHLEGQQKILVSKTLKEFEELLEEYGFLRVHQSHLINTRKVQSIIKSDGGYIRMNDGSDVIVSRRKKESVYKKLMK